MSFSLLQKCVAYLLSGIGLVALSFGGELSFTALAVLGAAYVASWFVEGKLIEEPWWSKGWTAFLMFAMAVQVARAIGGGAGWLGYAMEFAGLLTVSRLFNRRSAADYQQIAMLAFMHLIAATVLTNDLGYAGVFLAFVIVTPWALTLAHMRHEVERNYPKESGPDGGSDVRRVLSSRRLVGPAFLLWTALLSLPMLAMTVGLFLVFPRVGLGFVSLGQNRGQHVAGFGNKVELGGFGVIRDDPTVVVRVTPSRPLSSMEQDHYLRLRGTAFDHYDGRKWTRSEGLSVRMSAIGDYYALRRMPQNGDLELRIVLDRLDEAVLFLVPGTVGFRIPRRDVTTLRDRTRVTRSHGLDLRYQGTDEIGIVYHLAVSSTVDELHIPAARDMDDHERYLQVPAGHERVAELATKLRAGLDEPLAVANRLQAHLRDEERYAYTLQQPEVGSKHPLEVFLFEARRGHCEYFATALAVMLRTQGIPSRNVTGFVGGEWNRFGGYFAVRQADAHSWVEAYLEGHGWVTLDPTPPSRDAFGPEQLFRDIDEMVDALRAYWMTQVVGYDLRMQVRGLRELRNFFRGLSMPDLGFGGKGKGQRGGDAAEIERPSGTGSLLVAALAIVALLVAGAYALRTLRRRQGKRLASVSARQAQALYRQLERALAQKGRARPAHVTPEAHARALEAQGFPAAGAVRELTDVYLAARYGTAHFPRERVRAIKQKLEDVRRAA
jgi:hypothetical protein